jgi:hypothetical protein
MWIGLVAVVLTAAGCVKVGGDEPLVRIGDKGYLGGSSSDVETEPQRDDSDEVRALKDYVEQLERKLAEEKAKRKGAEQERDFWKKQAENAGVRT